jgi:NAD(P)H dehydrogenase (quinone)
MARILVLYYSSYGHIAKMADAVAEGVRQAGHECDVRRVPETAPPEVAQAAGFIADDTHPLVDGINSLAEYDGLIIGAPTRFGRMPSQMGAFLDQAGGLWYTDALVGKAAAAFTSTAAQHGGQETTLFSIITNLLHFGCTVVGLDYGFKGQNGVQEVMGNSPYGASTIANNDGSRLPSGIELDGARYLGRRVAETAAKLIA